MDSLYIYCSNFDFFQFFEVDGCCFVSSYLRVFCWTFSREMAKDRQDLPGGTLAACGNHHGGIGGEGIVCFSYQLNIEGKLKLDYNIL